MLCAPLTLNLSPLHQPLQERNELLEHLDRRPDSMWRTGTQWSFKNEARVYGSPMLDAAWAELVAGQLGGGDNPLPAMIAELRAAPIPFTATSPVKGRGKAKKPRDD